MGDKEFNEALEMIDKGLDALYYTDNYEAYNDISGGLMVMFLTLRGAPFLTVRQQCLIARKFKHWINIEHGKQKYFSPLKSHIKECDDEFLNGASYDEYKKFYDEMLVVCDIDRKRLNILKEHLVQMSTKLIDMRSELTGEKECNKDRPSEIVKRALEKQKSSKD